MLKRILSKMGYSMTKIATQKSDSEWFSQIKKSYPQGSITPHVLPAFPDEQLQINTVGTCGVDALVQAYEFYLSVKEGISRKEREIPSHGTVLDFGCGWGRISRFFINDVGIDNIIGLDVEKDFIGICQDTFSSKNFHCIPPHPPLADFQNECCDLIVAYSVFSHLSEASFISWMREFYRLLRPKGVVAFTTRHRMFFDHCESLKTSGGNYQQALSQMFDDFDEARQRYDAGEFVFSATEGVSGGGAMNDSFYGEAFIPEKYARQQADKLGFKDVEVIAPHDRVDQQTYLFFK